MKISVVIPVKNEAQHITALLDALLAQTRRPDEIVVADNGSTDTTQQIVERYTRPGSIVRLLRNGHGLPGAGRNRGTNAARHDWIAFTDAGTLPVPAWLAELEQAALAQPHTEAVYGAFQPVTDELFTECAAIAYVPPPTEIEGVLTRTRSTASLLLRRELWHKAGGFPEHLRSAEDLIFLDKIEAVQARIAHAPRAVVSWHLQPTLWRTFLRFIHYSRHNLRAGLWRSWQKPVLQRYLLFSLATLPAFFFGGFAWGLTAWLFLWLIFLAARAVVALRRNRVAYPAGIARNCLRFLILVPLLATLDAALCIGTLNWLLWDKLQMMEARVLDAP